MKKRLFLVKSGIEKFWCVASTWDKAVDLVKLKRSPFFEADSVEMIERFPLVEDPNAE